MYRLHILMRLYEMLTFNGINVDNIKSCTHNCGSVEIKTEDGECYALTIMKTEDA